MWWIKCPTENSYFRDGINPGLSEVRSKARVRENQKLEDQKTLVALRGGALTLRQEL